MDYAGLDIFTNMLAEYIENRIGKINGSNVKAWPVGYDKPVNYETIADNLNELWKIIGSGEGDVSITEKIENIIGEYVSITKIS